MSVRRAIPVALVAIVASGALTPALAAPKPKPKPMTAAYSLQLAPVPSPLATGVDGTNSCVDDRLEGVSTDTREIKTVGAGVLTVKVTGFVGDWDITVRDGVKLLGIGAGTTTGDPSSLGASNTESIAVKTRKATTLRLGVCNFLGGPEADVTYTFAYT